MIHLLKLYRFQEEKDVQDSNPRSREGSDSFTVEAHADMLGISIHALEKGATSLESA